jgi:hypothetical protein
MVLRAFLLFRANVLLKCADFDEPKPITSVQLGGRSSLVVQDENQPNFAETHVCEKMARISGQLRHPASVRSAQ